MNESSMMEVLSNTKREKKREKPKNRKEPTLS